MGDISSHQWSQWLKTLTSRPGWSIARLARETGIHRSTIHHWLTNGGDTLTIATIRLIATSLDEPFETALRAAGNLPPNPTQPIDEELELIRRARVDPDTKLVMLQRWLARRDRERTARIEDLRLTIDITERPH